MSRIYTSSSINSRPSAISSAPSSDKSKVLYPTVINTSGTKLTTPPPQPPTSTTKLNEPSHTTCSNLTGEKTTKTESNNGDIKMADDLTKLISRLETVTNRLENIAQHSSGAPTVNGTKTAQNGTPESLPASIAGFDDIINGPLAAFKDLSTKIGPEVKNIVDLVDKVFKLERSFLIEAARSAQPSQDVLGKFYQQFSKSLEEVQAFKEKNRSSPLFNHLSTISESIGALGWIAVSPAPAPYVKEMSDSGQFFSNRVLKDYKEKDQNHVNWVKQWLQLLSELQAYVKQTHTTGVTWNSTRQSKTFDLSRVNASEGGSTGSTSAPSAGGPPPPPPPPVPSFNDLFADSSTGSEQQQGSAHLALFAEINKGSDITKTLKKVGDDQKTHKNPNLRAANTVPGAPSTVKSIKTGPGASSAPKPPVFELQDKKWRIEYQTNKNNLVVSDTDLKQTIYVFNCSECTITVKGKVNSITIDSCYRVGLLFDDVLSMVEFINSNSVQMQVIGRCPTVSIDKTDGCQVYLSRDSIGAEIVTSKSSAMNILIPNENDDEYTEHPVPEQYKTIFNPKNKKLVTTPTECA